MIVDLERAHYQEDAEAMLVAQSNVTSNHMNCERHHMLSVNVNHSNRMHQGAEFMKVNNSKCHDHHHPWPMKSFTDTRVLVVFPKQKKSWYGNDSPVYPNIGDLVWLMLFRTIACTISSRKGFIFRNLPLTPRMTTINVVVLHWSFEPGL